MTPTASATRHFAAHFGPAFQPELFGDIAAQLQGVPPPQPAPGVPEPIPQNPPATPEPVPPEVEEPDAPGEHEPMGDPYVPPGQIIALH